VITETSTDPQTVRIDQLPFGTHLEVETETRTYKIEVLRGGYMLISGHPRHCPVPLLAKLCRRSDSADVRSITEGSSLKYFHPERGIVRTSPIRRIKETAPESSPDTVFSRLPHFAEVEG
jgi:hypothetical protein